MTALQANAVPESAKAGANENPRRPDSDAGPMPQWAQPIAGVLTTGLLKPQTANSIRGAYHELLGHHDRAGRTGKAATELVQSSCRRFAIIRQCSSCSSRF